MNIASVFSAATQAAEEALNKILQRNPKRDGQDAVDFYTGVFGDGIWGKSKWAEVLSKDASLKFRDKLVLIAAEKLLSENLLFQEIHQKVEPQASRRSIASDYDGLYRYWRYFQDSQQKNETLRWGLVEIATHKDSHTELHHWSYDVIRKSKLDLSELAQMGESRLDHLKGMIGPPEDEGLVFTTDAKLFMLAFRQHNIRLAIADLPIGPATRSAAGMLKTSNINGIVLTNRRNTIIYSAAFTMFHSTNSQFCQDMSAAQFLQMRAAHADEKHLTLSHR